MEKNKEAITPSGSLAISYERYINGYREYKNSRIQQADKEGERYGNRTRVEQTQR